jgi:hypothetical protein
MGGESDSKSECKGGFAKSNTDGMIGLINRQSTPRDDSTRGICFFAAADTDKLPLVARLCRARML